MENLIEKYKTYIRNLESNMDVITPILKEISRLKILAYTEIITDLENMRESKKANN